MEIQNDVSLEYALKQVQENPAVTLGLPLLGLDSEIRMKGAETPGTYEVTMWSIGANPFQTSAPVTVNPLQFVALFGPLFRKNQAVLERRGHRLAAEIEEFLKEQA